MPVLAPTKVKIISQSGTSTVLAEANGAITLGDIVNISNPVWDEPGDPLRAGRAQNEQEDGGAYGICLKTVATGKTGRFLVLRSLDRDADFVAFRTAVIDFGVALTVGGVYALDGTGADGKMSLYTTPDTSGRTLVPQLIGVAISAAAMQVNPNGLWEATSNLYWD